MKQNIDVTRQFAEFAARGSFEDLPDSTVDAGRRTVANALALSVGAAKHPAVESALATVRVLETEPQASILGRAERVGAMWAPLINGIGAHVEDFDDTHLDTVIHPGAPIVPAALAAAELVGASGRDMLAALVFGAETALRIGRGMGPGHFDRGWHVTGTAGHLGAAVAAGRLLDLSEEELIVAIGLASTQAAGLQEALGTMTKSLHPGKAASDGLEAALLALEGFTGPARPIEGRRGLAEVASPEQDYQKMVCALGDSWELEKNTFKPYACGIVSHPVIDGAIMLRGKLDPDSEVAEAVLRVNPVVLDVMGVKEPQSGLQSKFSVYHCLAVGFLYGAAGPAQFEESQARAPRVVDVREKVRVEPDSELARDEAHVTIRMSDGAGAQQHIEHATGSAESPMTNAQLKEKMRLVAEPILGSRVDAFVDNALKVHELDSVDILLDAARPKK